MNHSYQILAGLLLLASACSTPGASVIPRYGALTLDGKFSASDGGNFASSSFDDLGVNETEDSFSPAATLTVGGLDIAMSFLSTSFKGDGTTDGAIEIDGDLIPANTDVDTDVKFETFSTVATWDLVPSDLVDFGLGLGVTVVHFDLDMEESLGNEEIESDETFPVPYFAARGSVDIGDFDLTGTIGYMDIDVSDGDLTYLEYDVALHYHLFGGAKHAAGHIGIGYRGFDVDADYDDGDSDVHADFTLDGPYVGLAISF